MNTGGHKASLKISRDVIETIASVAALEIEGVASLAEPHGTVEGFFKNRMNKGKIETTITNGIAEISLCLNMELGARISEVCMAVQQSVKENVQTMTGVIVNRVNITVIGVRLPENGSEQKDGTTGKKEIEIE